MSFLISLILTLKFEQNVYCSRDFLIGRIGQFFEFRRTKKDEYGWRTSRDIHFQTTPPEH